MDQYDSVIDLVFALRGTVIPADHGYLLYAAISRHLPSIHGNDSVGVHPIRGQLTGHRLLSLTRNSHLVLRLPAELIPSALTLSGMHLDLGGAVLQVGVPHVRALEPSATLISRLVVIRGFTEADAFGEAANRQVSAHGITGALSVVTHRRAQALEDRIGSRDSVVRRTLRIKDKEIVGFAVRVSELTPEHSVRLQALCLGGRRRFGCGVFVPERDRTGSP